MHQFYIPKNISKLKEGMNFKQKEKYDFNAYKGFVTKLMNDQELWLEFWKDIVNIKEGRRRTLLKDYSKPDYVTLHAKDKRGGLNIHEK